LKVTNVEFLSEEEDVYDLTVSVPDNDPDGGNFCLENGVVVHNSGKTEAELTLAQNQLRKYGTGLILVPNLNIRDQFIDRASDYGIELLDYSKVRRKALEEYTIITTPTIFANDITDGSSLYRDRINWIITDECHHSASETFFHIYRNCSNIMRSHGFSATPIDYDSDKVSSFRNIPIDDAIGMSTVGPVIYSKTAQDLREFLNIPILVNINFKWEDKVYSGQMGNNPQAYMEAVHSYTNRIDFICQIHRLLLFYGYNTMHHVFRKEYGAVIRNALNNSKVVTWYGSGYVHQSGTEELLDKPQLRSRFGIDINDIIATSHAIEGLDLPSPIDCLIISEGRKEKATIQKIGRGTRPSTRKSITINVYDHNCAIAHSQSRKRSDALENEFGITPIIVNSISDLDKVLRRINQI